MSDGPHRSLNMRPKWRKLAEWADTAAFDSKHVSEAVGPALKDDWKQDECDQLMQALCSLMGTNTQGSIFEAESASELETLRRDLVAGRPFAQLLIEHVIRAASFVEYSPSEALIRGTESALMTQAMKGRFQVEEHYVRQSSDHRAMRVGHRLEEAMSQCDFTSLAKELTGQSSAKSPSQAPLRKGVEDGVAL